MDDSMICTAAIMSGAITNKKGGTVSFIIKPPIASVSDSRLENIQQGTENFIGAVSKLLEWIRLSPMGMAGLVFGFYDST